MTPPDCEQKQVSLHQLAAYGVPARPCGVWETESPCVPVGDMHGVCVRGVMLREGFRPRLCVERLLYLCLDLCLGPRLFESVYGRCVLCARPRFLSGRECVNLREGKVCR